MTTDLQAMEYNPENKISEIADFLGDPVAAADFPETILRYRNDRAAKEIGLDGLNDQDWIRHFGRFHPLPNTLQTPVALRYHGHQFRNYNPDIGDGRGFLFAQMRDFAGRLMDLGTKGSGQTPYSRFGDGRLTLKGAVREILATEMLEAQGVETSRTFSVIETGEQLHRGDEPSPTRSAVLVRLNHGSIRIGSFQRLAYLKQSDALTRLTQFTLKNYFGQNGGDEPAARLLEGVVERTARLAASYMAAGFVHGVLNTDNINVTGESFDYGPWRWTPHFDPDFTAAYFDENGLYAFGRQAEAIHWNVVQLAIALTSITDQDALLPILNKFGAQYHSALIERMMWRLNCKPRGAKEDAALIAATEQALGKSGCALEPFFFHSALRTWSDPVYDGPEMEDLQNRIKGYPLAYSTDLPYWQRERPCTLLIDEVEAIWEPIAKNDDWTALNHKIEDIRQAGAATSAILT
jgi:serine/tyrosine/threonine adenylyltransferase